MDTMLTNQDFPDLDESATKPLFRPEFAAYLKERRERKKFHITTCISVPIWGFVFSFVIQKRSN